MHRVELVHASGGDMGRPVLLLLCGHIHMRFVLVVDYLSALLLLCVGALASAAAVASACLRNSHPAVLVNLRSSLWSFPLLHP